MASCRGYAATGVLNAGEKCHDLRAFRLCEVGDHFFEERFAFLGAAEGAEQNAVIDGGGVILRIERERD